MCKDKLLNVEVIVLKKTTLEILNLLCENKGFEKWYFQLNDKSLNKIESDMLKILKRRINGE